MTERITIHVVAKSEDIDEPVTLVVEPSTHASSVAQAAAILLYSADLAESGLYALQAREDDGPVVSVYNGGELISDCCVAHKSEPANTFTLVELTDLS